MLATSNQCHTPQQSVSNNFQVAVGTMVVPDVGFLFFSPILSTCLVCHWEVTANTLRVVIIQFQLFASFAMRGSRNCDLSLT